MKYFRATSVAALAVWSQAALGLTTATTRDALDSAPSGLVRPAESIDTLPSASTSQPRQAMPTDPQPQRPTQSGNPLWAIPLSALSNTRSRPIFSPSRRPPPAVAAPVAALTVAVATKPKDPERPQLALVGTIAGQDERFGVFINQSTATALRLKVGEDFQGWVLREVQAREATLEKDRQNVVLSLPQPGTAPAAPMTMGTPARPGQPPILPSPEQRKRGQRQM